MPYAHAEEQALKNSQHAQVDGVKGNLYLANLTRLLQTYEAGFAYLYKCDDYKGQMEAFPNYMENAKVVMSSIVEELMRLRPDRTKQEAVDFVMKKRQVVATEVQKNFDKQGCEGQLAGAAKTHFDRFKDVTPVQVQSFIFAMKKNGGEPPRSTKK